MNTDYGTLNVASSTPFNFIPCPSLTFGGGKIIINTDTGEVQLNGIEPSEAAKEFWRAVREHFRK